MSHRALDRDRAAMQLGEQLHHREPEAGALELARQPAVDLAEGLEELLQPVGGDADATVADGHLEKFRELIARERTASPRPAGDEPSHAGAGDPPRRESHRAAL